MFPRPCCRRVLISAERRHAPNIVRKVQCLAAYEVPRNRRGAGRESQVCLCLYIVQTQAGRSRAAKTFSQVAPHITIASLQRPGTSKRCCIPRPQLDPNTGSTTICSTGLPTKHARCTALGRRPKPIPTRSSPWTAWHSKIRGSLRIAHPGCQRQHVFANTVSRLSCIVTSPLQSPTDTQQSHKGLSTRDTWPAKRQLIQRLQSL